MVLSVVTFQNSGQFFAFSLIFLLAVRSVGCSARVLAFCCCAAGCVFASNFPALRRHLWLQEHGATRVQAQLPQVLLKHCKNDGTQKGEWS